MIVRIKPESIRRNICVRVQEHGNAVFEQRVVGFVEQWLVELFQQRLVEQFVQLLVELQQLLLE